MFDKIQRSIINFKYNHNRTPNLIVLGRTVWEVLREQEPKFGPPPKYAVKAEMYGMDIVYIDDKKGFTLAFQELFTSD
jgi:hypothetical protein